jgi:hypothetical protein
MGGINTLIVLDSRFVSGAGGALKACRYWIEAKEEMRASLNLYGNEPPSGWRAQHQGLKESGLANWAVALTGDGRLAGL